MGYSAKVQGHKASAPSYKLGSPARRILPSASSPASAPESGATPPDWDAWIERADRLGHSLERLVQPTLKGGAAPPAGLQGSGVVQLKNGKKGKKGKPPAKREEKPPSAPPPVTVAASAAVPVGVPARRSTGKTVDEAKPAPAKKGALSPSTAAMEAAPPVTVSTTAKKGTRAPAKKKSEVGSTTKVPTSAAATAAAPAGESEEPTFESLDAMLAHLASEFKQDVDQLKELVGINPDLFSSWADLGPDDIDSDWEGELIGLKMQLKRTPPSAGGIHESGDWAVPSIRKEAKEIAGRGGGDFFPKGEYTLYHKISKAQLRKLAGAMEAEGPAAGSLRELAMEGMGFESTSPLKSLLSMPGNLEIGPYAEEREGDPGAGFDPNVTATGELTPRSKILEEVNTMISDNKIDWDKVTRKLSQVQALQKRKTAGGRLLSDPLKGQWLKGHGDKFKRKPRSEGDE